jgi:hypothetical protein
LREYELAYFADNLRTIAGLPTFFSLSSLSSVLFPIFLSPNPFRYACLSSSTLSHIPCPHSTTRSTGSATMFGGFAYGALTRQTPEVESTIDKVLCTSFCENLTL